MYSLYAQQTFEVVRLVIQRSKSAWPIVRYCIYTWPVNSTGNIMLFAMKMGDTSEQSHPARIIADTKASEK